MANGSGIVRRDVTRREGRRADGVRLGRGQRLERHDQCHRDVDEDPQAPEEDRQEPQDPDEGRVGLEILGDARGDARDAPVVPAAVQTTVHLQPPIGLMSRAPRVT